MGITKAEIYASRMSLRHRKALLPVLLINILFAGSVLGERLPLKSYTVAEGLAHNQINKIVRDSRGFLWFCTAEGLSRFDGYQFTNFGTNEGLPHPVVNDLLETKSGDYWVATNGGLVRLNARGAPSNRTVYGNEIGSGTPPMFVTFVPEDPDRRAHVITILLEAADGTIWCGTYKGLYRLNSDLGQFKLEATEIGIPNEYADQHLISDVIEDGQHLLWIGTPSGLYRRSLDGSATRYTKREGLPDDYIHDLFKDHQGQLWAGTRSRGFFRFGAAPTRNLILIGPAYSVKDGMPGNWVFQIFETGDHRFWLGTSQGLTEFFPQAAENNARFHTYTTRNGLSFHDITALNDDLAGNLWLGSYAGAMKFSRGGFITYDENDGLLQANAVLQDRDGGICIRGYVTGPSGGPARGKSSDPVQTEAQVLPTFGRFDGKQFTWFLPGIVRSSLGWVGEDVTLLRRNGEWWIGAGDGLYRFGIANLKQLKDKHPLKIFTTKDGLAAQQIYRLFEDSQGDVWIVTTSSSMNGLARWDHSTNQLQDLSGKMGLPSLKDNLPRVIGEDGAGEIWIGFSSALLRYRNSQFDAFASEQGLSLGGIEYIYRDHSGRLWLASTRGGLIRVDDPSAEKPSFTAYTTARGLSSNNVSVITEDLHGNIYAGTGHGVDRLNTTTGAVKHFTTADGLATGAILSALCQSDGTLWFGTQKGLSRLSAEPEAEQAAPLKVLIKGLSVAGSPSEISALGEEAVVLPDLRSNQNEVQIEFVGLSFAPGDVLRYEYKLGHSDWSGPSEQRVVTFANLSSGTYHFAVQAVNSEGRVSSEPASVTFTILTPLWLRWWAIALAILLTGATIFWLYRFRVQRLLEIANMRTRIATDLHDDIGANLTRISILSEVAKRQFSNGSNGSGNPLSAIADIARESVTSMSDIVWSISPEADSLRDLVRKMRQHADEVFTLRDIELEFRAPGPDQELKLGVNVRRDVLLIFKESVNNAARHSHCSHVEIDFSANAQRLSLRVADNGRGFDPQSENLGRGLKSMRRRALSLGGLLEVESAASRGTTVTVTIPLSQSSFLGR